MSCFWTSLKDATQLCAVASVAPVILGRWRSEWFASWGDSTNMYDDDTGTYDEVQPPFNFDLNMAKFGINFDGTQTITRVEVDISTSSGPVSGTTCRCELKSSAPLDGGGNITNHGSNVVATEDLAFSDTLQTLVFNSVSGVGDGVVVYAQSSETGPYKRIHEIRAYL